MRKQLIVAEGAGKKKGGNPPTRATPARVAMELCCSANLAADAVARLVINIGEIVLLAAMLLGAAHHFIRAGAAGFPLALVETHVRAAEMIVIAPGGRVVRPSGNVRGGVEISSGNLVNVAALWTGGEWSASNIIASD